MEREWTGDPRRLSQADRLQIESLIQGGDRFATTGAAAGCSTKSVQRYRGAAGGSSIFRTRSAATSVSC